MRRVMEGLCSRRLVLPYFLWLWAQRDMEEDEQMGGGMGG